MSLVKKPFFLVNPKSYLYGDKILKLAKIADKIAQKYQIDVLFSGQLVDLPRIKSETHNLILTAQHMDSLVAGRGMGHVLPEAVKNVGIKAVVLNHAENPLTLSVLDKTIKRAKEVGLFTIVCSDTVEQCRAVAELGPNMMICEPTSLIGTGNTSDDKYIVDTVKAVKEINPQILVLEAAGVSTGKDVEKVLRLGADGTGGTSGIINAPNWEDKLNEMILPMKKYKEEN
ncbi:triose-phosphate isomerase [Lactobacillus sp. ESL0791]|uniref:triose-phosphate isomerase n=1 Tax=Lactobacillus sp. ESL0791 TaxID=2983234 RepID=UPI0023F62108|nr:triose-phosphate isomerase [Lactobacillus sp. ESL0791]MDF7639590.1 triose-phosphate isomerase [Lactobacillus sp. ESL0791]